MSTAHAVAYEAAPADIGEVTLLATFLAHDGNPNERGLLMFAVDDDVVIPSCFLQSPGRLKPLVRSINTLYLKGTATQRYAWWTTPNHILSRRKPIDLVDADGDTSNVNMLIGAARMYTPSDS